MTHLSRRTILKGAFLGSTSLLVSFDQLFGYSRLAAQTSDDNVETILNLAATAEAYACTHYYSVLTEGNVALTPLEIDEVKGFLDAELFHLEYLAENNAQPLTNQFYLPSDIYTDRDQFSEVTEFLETTFVAAYLATTRRLAELGKPLLAATAAQIVGIEQEHLALVRQIGGKRANNLSFSRPLFYNVSEAGSALQPFLEGGDNYTGPVAYPGPDAIRQLIGDVGVVPVPTFTHPTDFAPASSVTAATCSAMVSGNYNCNLRSGPGIAYAIVDQLHEGDILTIDAQATDKDGYTWWRATSGDKWVRSDIVRLTAVCGTLPVVGT